MLDAITQLGYKIQAIGVQDEQDEQSLYIGVLNFGPILGFLIGIYYSLFYAIVDAELFLPIILVNCCFLIVYALALFLNWRFQHQTAIWLFFLGAYSQIAIDTWLMGRDSGIAIFALGVSLFPMLTIADTHRWSKIILIAISPMIVLLCHFSFETPYIQDYPSWVSSFIFVLSTFSTVAVVVITVIVFAHRLSQTNQRLEIALDHMPGGMLLLDSDDKVLRYNEGIIKLLEVPTELIQSGASLSRVAQYMIARADFEKDGKLPTAADINRIFTDGSAHQYERKLKSGRYLELSIAPTPGGGSVAVAQDISHRKKTELQLVEAKITAEQANRAKSEFLASMSHELRTPLNAVLGFAQLLKTNPYLNLHTKQFEQIDHILVGGNHLLNLVNDILDLSKVEANQIEFFMESIDLCEIVSDAIDIINPLTTNEDILVCNNLTSPNPIQITSDRARLTQVLINILANAVKYNIKSGRITIYGEQISEDHYRLSIADTGIGISELDQPKVFQMFHRLDVDATQSKEGSGIGLYVCAMLIKKMGGSVDFVSKLDEGTTFWLDLPMSIDTQTTSI